MTIVRLWFVRESEKARRYCKLPLNRNPGDDTPDNPNYIWVPRSVCERTAKFPAEGSERPVHEIEVADWFAERENL